MFNDFTKKEAPILSTLGLGGGNASRSFLSGAVLSNRSLRFNPADSPTLSRTFASAGNRRTWTFSCWVKRTTSFNTYRHTLASGPGTTLSFSETAQGGPDEWFFYVDGTPYLLSNAKLRDTSAWYHAVFVFDTTNSTQADRCRVYQNGERVTSWRNTAYPSQNFEGNFNTAGEIKIGCGNANEFLDGYMTDVYFIDGLALDPTSFGASDSNGVWQRSTYSGSYGTNGFHILDFANDGTIGNDTSGNGNHFTANNFSTSAGSGNDLLFDFPTNDTVNTDSGAGGEVTGNYATLNSLQKGSNVTLSNGDLDYTASTETHANKLAFSTISVSSGKWYAEATCTAKNDNFYVGVMGNVSENFIPPYTTSLGYYATGWGYWSDGDIYNNGSVIDSAPASVGVNDVVGVALDVDNRTVTFYKNGVQQGSTATSLTADATWNFAVASYINSSISWNFGQRPFEYAAPTNHKCLTTTSLPTPGVADGSDYFDAKLWTGTGSSQAINTYSFSPDMAWIKVRNNAGSFALLDTIRGNSKVLRPDNNSSEQTNESVFSTFDSNGFTLGADTSNGWTNYNTWTYVGWAWEAGSSTVSNSDGNISSNVRASQTSGFSVVTYSGNDSTSGSVGHGLGKKPGMIIVKTTNDNRDWKVAHSSLSTTHMLTLNENYAAAAASWNGMNSSVFYPARSGDTYLNTNGRDYVAYCFAPIEGYSAVGVYSPNNSADGPYIATGFRPAFIMFKQSDSASQPWIIHDYKRNGFNKTDPYFITSGNNSEFSDNGIDILSNGWKIRNNNAAWNGSSGTYVWFAAAENPFQANGGLAR